MFSTRLFLCFDLNFKVSRRAFWVLIQCLIRTSALLSFASYLY
uniref:Uncharacterized protein n=1 Tax=Podoviridae sp. ctqve24 TaxID=2826580 RepID=A0A8S5MGT6_9CAUD|nr:MAG TPA: hypothetical protein [Podoviridae sp. ctqve24]